MSIYYTREGWEQDDTIKKFKARLVVGEDQCANILTKALARISFMMMRNSIGIQTLSKANLKFKEVNVE